MIYKVETIKDGTEKYFFIRNLETMSIEELPSKYLTLYTVYPLHAEKAIHQYQQSHRKRP